MLTSNWSSKFLTFLILFFHLFSYCFMFRYISSILFKICYGFSFLKIFQVLFDICNFLSNIILFLFRDDDIFSKNICNSLNFFFSLQKLVLSNFFSSVDLTSAFHTRRFPPCVWVILSSMLTLWEGPEEWTGSCTYVNLTGRCDGAVSLWNP